MFNRILITVDMSHADKLTKALGIAGDICIYTNNNLTVEVLDGARSEGSHE